MLQKSNGQGMLSPIKLEQKLSAQNFDKFRESDFSNYVAMTTGDLQLNKSLSTQIKEESYQKFDDKDDEENKNSEN